jgi:uncharacterized protein
MPSIGIFDRRRLSAWCRGSARAPATPGSRQSAFIYPTIGVNWESECDDADYAQAMCRKYNRWLLDWCSEGDGRLVPVAHLSLSDPAAAAAELERAVKAGCKGGWVAQFAMTRKPHAHPDHDVLFVKAQELNVPIGLHPSLEPPWAMPGRFDRQYIRTHTFFLNVTASDAIRHALTSFIQNGTFDKFPRLKIVVLEVGAGWISYWLDRMDAVYASGAGRSVPLKEKPSFYFKRNVWISADPDEHILPAIVELIGEDTRLRGGAGSLRRCSLLAPRAQQAGPFSTAFTHPQGQALARRQQEQRPRCGGDL